LHTASITRTKRIKHFRTPFPENRFPIWNSAISVREINEKPPKTAQSSREKEKKRRRTVRRVGGKEGVVMVGGMETGRFETESLIPIGKLHIVGMGKAVWR
jgi:hypothetical protein